MLTRLAIVAGFAAVTFCSAVGLAQTAYTVTDLGNLGYSSYPDAINGSGQIVGVSYSNSAYVTSPYVYQYAFLYDASSTGSKTMTPLLTNSSAARSTARPQPASTMAGRLSAVFSTAILPAEPPIIKSTRTTPRPPGQVIPISFNMRHDHPADQPWRRVHRVGVCGHGHQQQRRHHGDGVLPGDTANTQYGYSFDTVGLTGSIFPSPASFFGSGVVASTNAINLSGVVAITLATSAGGSHLAYYYDPSNGGVNQINTPLDTSSLSYYCDANGINNSGVIVGGGVVSTVGNGALSTPTVSPSTAPARSLTSADLDTGNFSEAQGINSAGGNRGPLHHRHRRLRLPCLCLQQQRRDDRLELAPSGQFRLDFGGCDRDQRFGLDRRVRGQRPGRDGRVPLGAGDHGNPQTGRRQW